MLKNKLRTRTIENNKMQANIGALKLIALQNDLKLCTARGFRICRAILERSINQN